MRGLCLSSKSTGGELRGSLLRAGGSLGHQAALNTTQTTAGVERHLEPPPPMIKHVSVSISSKSKGTNWMAVVMLTDICLTMAPKKPSNNNSEGLCMSCK